MHDVAGVKIVVTGANGFIGSHCVQTLVQAGAEVYSLLDPGVKSEWLSALKIKFVTVDEWKKGALESILKDIQPAGIINLRAKIHQTNISDAHELFRVNLDEVKELAEAAMTLENLKNFLHVGTIAEYGGSPAPFREDVAGKPISDYGKSKLVATEWLNELWRLQKFSTIVVRLSVVYGPGQIPHTYLIPNIILSCLRKKDFFISTNGLQTRDPIFVEDVVEGLMSALTSKVGGEIINLGLGQEYTVLAIAELINEILGNPIKIITGNESNRSGENDHYWHDIRKAKKLLDWSPATSLIEGLKKTILWYRECQSAFI